MTTLIELKDLIVTAEPMRLFQPNADEITITNEETGGVTQLSYSNFQDRMIVTKDESGSSYINQLVAMYNS